MKYNVNIENTNGLVHVLFDYTMDAYLKTVPSFVAKLRRIKYMSVSNNTSSSVVEITGGLRVYRPTMLDDLHAMGYKYAVFWMDGCVAVDGDMDNRILEWCNKNENWIISGWHANKLFEKTMVIINVEEWQKLPDKNFNIFRVVKSYLPFDRLFDRPECSILSLPEDMKDILDDFDIYNDTEYTNAWIMNYEPGFKKPDRPISEAKRNLHALKYMTDSIVYLTNTEPHLELTTDDEYVTANVDTFILPCSGLYQFMYLQYHIDSMKHVIFYDVNPHSVEWFKVLISSWDGKTNPVDTMHKFERDYIDSKPMLRSEFDIESVDEFMDLLSEDIRSRIMDKLQEIKVEFVVADICKDSSSLVNRVDYESVVLINYTNIMQYESNFLNSDIIDVDAEFYHTLSLLNKRASDVYLQGDSPHGININCANIKSIKGF